MLTLARLCLLSAAFTALVSAKPTPSPYGSSVYDNCSGKNPYGPPDDVESTPMYKPQVHVAPEDVLKNGTGWEEWLFIGHNALSDGSILDYGYKWARGDPTSGNISHTLFIAWAHFPNGSFYREIERGPFKFEEHSDGSLVYSIANNNLTWDPKQGQWKAAINANGYIIESVTEDLEPSTPFAPSYKSKPGQISQDFFSTVDVTHGRTKGKMAFPWGPKYPIESIGAVKHTWSYKVMADTLSAYVRGSTFVPGTSKHPAITVTWFQAWDPSGKEVDSIQFAVEPDLRLQITDTSKAVTIVTTPAPAPPPTSYEGTDISLPMCGPGADHKDKMTWKVHNVQKLFDFVDFANSTTLYRRVNMTGVVWVDGKAVDVAGGIGLAEVYHR